MVAAGITLHEALKAYEELKMKGIYIRVIDLYSIKPIDKRILGKAAKDTGVIITVETISEQEELGKSVQGALTKKPVPIYSLCVRKRCQGSRKARRTSRL